MKHFFLTLMAFFAIHIFLAAQNSLSVSAGLGSPELIHGEINYRFSDISVGLSIGGYRNREDQLMISEEKWTTLSGDVSMYWGSPSEKANLSVWYASLGATYEVRNYEISDPIVLRSTSSWFYGNILLGREINFSERLGINIDAGLSIEGLGFSDISKESLLPSGSINVFYRLSLPKNP